MQQITLVPDRAALQFALEQQKGAGTAPGAKPATPTTPQAQPKPPASQPK